MTKKGHFASVNTGKYFLELVNIFLQKKHWFLLFS